MKNLHRITVTYCQVNWTPKPMCKNGDPCHQSAPRGSKTGTQGLANAKDRGVIPPQLFEELLTFINL